MPCSTVLYFGRPPKAPGWFMPDGAFPINLVPHVVPRRCPRHARLRRSPRGSSTPPVGRPRQSRDCSVAAIVLETERGRTQRHPAAAAAVTHIQYGSPSRTANVSGERRGHLDGQGGCAQVWEVIERSKERNNNKGCPSRLGVTVIRTPR